MFKILTKEVLATNVLKMQIHAPLIAKKAQPGQFIIFRVTKEDERVPLTIADYDRNTGSITIIFQMVGASTQRLGALNVGDSLSDFVGPLGTPSHLDGLKKVAIVGGGVGCAIAYPIAKQLHKQGTIVHSVIGFRNQDALILENEFRAVSDELCLMSDDGSAGQKGLVTQGLAQFIDQNPDYDEVITIGPLIMMKFVCELTKKHNIKTTVSMNPIMIDGTGMCGCCRLSVDKKIKFACVDGPDFDGHLVDFDEAINRNNIYRSHELQREDECNLMNKEVA